MPQTNKEMGKFKGFSAAESFTEFPDTFFAKLLSDMESLDELKVVLFALWRSQHLDGAVHPLRVDDFDGTILGLTVQDIRSGLEKGVNSGILLIASLGRDIVYFVNSPRGREAAEAFASGKLREVAANLTAPLVRPNIFRLYEENIGPLTPLVAEALKDAEQSYSEEWIRDAIELAVTHNKRSWKYCEAILKRWKEEGRAEKQNRRDDQAARQREVEERIRKFFGG